MIYIIIQPLPPQNPQLPPPDEKPVPLAGGWILMIVGIMYVAYHYWRKRKKIWK
jgi:hypothetical protein